MRIKIRQKNLKAGRMSLYLDIHWNGRRWKEFLGIWLENPTNAAVQKENALKMQTAMRLCEERRVSLLMQESQAISSVLLVSDFLKVFDEFVVGENIFVVGEGELFGNDMMTMEIVYVLYPYS